MEVENKASRNLAGVTQSGSEARTKLSSGREGARILGEKPCEPQTPSWGPQNGGAVGLEVPGRSSKRTSPLHATAQGNSVDNPGSSGASQVSVTARKEGRSEQDSNMLETESEPPRS